MWITLAEIVFAICDYFKFNRFSEAVLPSGLGPTKCFANQVQLLMPMQGRMNLQLRPN